MPSNPFAKLRIEIYGMSLDGRNIYNPSLSLTMAHTVYFVPKRDVRTGWNDMFEIDVTLHQHLFWSAQLDLFESRFLLPKVHIGRTEIRLSRLISQDADQQTPKWYDLKAKNHCYANLDVIGMRPESWQKHKIGGLFLKVSYKILATNNAIDGSLSYNSSSFISPPTVDAGPGNPSRSPSTLSINALKNHLISLKGRPIKRRVSCPELPIPTSRRRIPVANANVTVNNAHATLLDPSLVNSMVADRLEKINDQNSRLFNSSENRPSDPIEDGYHSSSTVLKNDSLLHNTAPTLNYVDAELPPLPTAPTSAAVISTPPVSPTITNSADKVVTSDLEAAKTELAASREIGGMMKTISRWFFKEEDNHAFQNLLNELAGFGQGIEVGSIALTVAFFLAQKLHRHLPRPYGNNIVLGKADLEIPRIIYRYTYASLGWAGAYYFGKAGSNLSDGVRAHANIKAVIDFLQLDPDDLLVCDLDHNRLYRPNFFVAIDRRLSAVILSIRGTMSLRDTLTDLACDYVAWNGGMAHSGMLTAATWFMENIARQLILFAQEYGMENIFICGHSLGGGTAALTTIMLVEELSKQEITYQNVIKNQKYTHLNGNINTAKQSNYLSMECWPRREDGSLLHIHCYAYGTPAVVSPNLARRYVHLIDTFIYNDDIVPCLSYGSMADLQIEFIHAANIGQVKDMFGSLQGTSLQESMLLCRKKIKETNAASLNDEYIPPQPRYHSYVNGWREENDVSNSPPREENDVSNSPPTVINAESSQISSPTNNTNNDGGIKPLTKLNFTFNVKLHVPGKIHHIVTLKAPNNRSYTVIDTCGPERFTEIFLTKRMIRDHFPDRYEKAFEDAYVTYLLHELEERRIPGLMYDHPASLEEKMRSVVSLINNVSVPERSSNICTIADKEEEKSTSIYDTTDKIAVAKSNSEIELDIPTQSLREDTHSSLDSPVCSQGEMKVIDQLSQMVIKNDDTGSINNPNMHNHMQTTFPSLPSKDKTCDGNGIVPLKLSMGYFPPPPQPTNSQINDPMRKDGSTNTTASEVEFMALEQQLRKKKHKKRKSLRPIEMVSPPTLPPFQRNSVENGTNLSTSFSPPPPMKQQHIDT